MERLNVLVVDDEPGIRNEIEEFLTEKFFNVFQAGLPSEAFRIMGKEAIHICILDIRLPEMNGIDVLEKIKSDHPATEVIIVTAHGEMDTVITALRLGAIDFFNKPFMLKDLDRAIQKTRAYIRFQRLKESDGSSQTIISQEIQDLLGHRIVGESTQMKDLLKFMKSIASTNSANVLVTGESGTGKELVARAIHYLSPRRKNQFCAVNCASVPEELFESEFFGHIRGAFTGAISEKAGWFETAHKGTLFLDEIGDMKLSAQPKLLRVLDDLTVVRLGSTKKIAVDVRVIAATNNNLVNQVEQRQFRPDLFYRLNAITIHIPPLRERKDDILPLFNNFLRDYSASISKPIDHVAASVIEWLLGYHFPGNVRELKHMVERAIILSSDHTLTLQHFIRPGNSSVKPLAPPTTGDGTSLPELEKQTIMQVLKKAKYVKVQAAKLLNISRQALDRKIEKYGIPVSWK